MSEPLRPDPLCEHGRALDMHCCECSRRGFFPPEDCDCYRWNDGNQGRAWPEAVSDGLTMPCADCGQVPRFDYQVTDEFWRRHVPEQPDRLGVVCLPCLDRRCSGKGLAEALCEVQWTGTGHTVVLAPALLHHYRPRRGRTP